MAKKKKRPDDDDEKPAKKGRGRADDEDEEDDGEEPSDKPKNDVYVGLGVVTLLALIAGATFLYLDHDTNSKKQPPTVTVSVGDLKLGGK